MLQLWDIYWQNRYPNLYKWITEVWHIQYFKSDLKNKVHKRILGYFITEYYICIEVKWKSLSHSQLFVKLWTHSQCNSPSQVTGMGSLSLLQEIFPNQGLNPGLSHCKWILYQLSHKGSPRILVLLVYPFSRGSFRPNNWTRVSCIAGRFFTNWAIREAPKRFN